MNGDQYAQDAAITVVESAATTLTFQQLLAAGNVFERRAMVIHRIEYVPTVTSLNLILDENDYIQFGLCTNNQIATISYLDPNVVDFYKYGMKKFGVAASGFPVETPFVRDFTALPGGGKIIPSYPIYGYAQGVSIAGAITVLIRFQFTIKTLKPEEYIELVEAARVIT